MASFIQVWEAIDGLVGALGGLALAELANWRRRLSDRKDRGDTDLRAAYEMFFNALAEYGFMMERMVRQLTQAEDAGSIDAEAAAELMKYQVDAFRLLEAARSRVMLLDPDIERCDRLFAVHFPEVDLGNRQQREAFVAHIWTVRRDLLLSVRETLKVDLKVKGKGE